MTNSSSIAFTIADGFFARLRGLLGTSSNWGDGYRALLIPRCCSVHTFGMRYPLDIAFVDAQGTVLRSERNVVPGRLLSCKGACFVLERPSRLTNWWPLQGNQLNIGSHDEPTRIASKPIPIYNFVKQNRMPRAQA